MKWLLLPLFLLMTFESEGYTMQEIRELFHESEKTEEAAKKMLVLLKDVDSNDQPIKIAYKGMAYIMLSKHAFNPINKLKYFNLGKDFLENAISKDQNDMELRFLRYAVQINVPFFLNYNSSIKKDKKLVFDGIPELKDLSVKKIVIDFMLKTDDCTVSEKKWLREQANNT